MKYISKTLVKDGEIYHYKFSDLKDFIKRGKEDGNVGCILISRIKRFNKYKGFGTIENPCNFIRTITIQNHPLFDDNYKGNIPIKNFRFITLNMKENER